MDRSLLAALLGGGIATLVLGELAPFYVAVPIVVVVAVALAVVLRRALARPFVAQLQGEREFSSNVAHQLRTPLAALRMRLEDVTLWPEADLAVKAEMQACVHEVDRLAGTIDDYLALARSGSIGSTAVFDAAKAATVAAERWRPHFETGGRALLLDADGVGMRLTTSERAFSQVMDVLLENALVHGQGTARVAVLSDGSRGVVRVSDEGALDERDAQHLFERSFRSATSEGSGIGLALAKEICESSGGRLRVVNLDPTCFEVAFLRA